MDAMVCFVHRIFFLGAVVCITASANLMIEYNWPEPDRNINRFPHESSCHYYYLMMSEEDITIEKCPDGQLFDYVKHSCISDKEHIHCWSRHFAKIKHGHMHIKHKKHFQCPYPWGKYPNFHDCKKYHLCFNGKSTAKKCAPYELFDKISRKCIASIDAVCADKTDVVENGYICPKTWGSFTYSKDCSKYYECLQRKPSLRTCQKGCLFDDRLAKCSPKEHVYCGLRYNPYEKVSSGTPETPSVPNTTYKQKSTTLAFDVTTIKENIKPAKQISQETKSIPLETSSAFKEITSLPEKIVPTFKKVTSLSQETSSAFNEISSHLEKIASAINRQPEETVSTFQKVTSIAHEISSTLPEVTSNKVPENQPITSELSNSTVAPEADKNEIIKVIRITTAKPNMAKLERQKTSDVAEEVSEKDEFVEISATTQKEQVMISTQTAFDNESEDSKKDVSTEEKDSNGISIHVVTLAPQEIQKTSEVSTETSSKTGCLPKDSMCITEKDGTVVKCSSSKDLQPHPKDERRFLDCTEDKIHVFTCPPNLTFHPEKKRCEWQFIL